MDARWRWSPDPRAARLLEAAVLASVAAWAWRRPLGEPMRGPAIAAAIVALVFMAARAARPSARSLGRAAEVARTAALLYVVASWDGPPWWVSMLAAVGLGAIDGRTARADERSMAGVALGGALAVGWNAWRFGAPAQRVFAVAMAAAVAVALSRRRPRATF